MTESPTLEAVKLPWKKDVDAPSPATEEESPVAEETTGSGKGSAYTPGKGRPTPSRRQAQGRKRGPVTPAPTTRAEARARKKELKSTMTREEKRAAADDRRERRLKQREGMMAGDERYLLPRDQGPVRKFARDIVDSRRNLAGLFMPFAIVLIFFMFTPISVNYPMIMNIVLLLFVVVMIVDAVVLGRLVNRRVRERYPDSADGGFKLGWYSFSRAMQLRKMRAPRPQVSAGDPV
jgi:hypothetical protein